MSSKLFDLGHNKFLQDTSLKAKEIKTKMNYGDFIKMKMFSTAKQTINKTKRQPTESQKILANDITDKGLVSKIYTELLKLDTQEMGRRHREILLMKKCSTSLAIREIQIKITMRYHLTSVRMVKINKAGNKNCWRGCGERGTLLHYS